MKIVFLYSLRVLVNSLPLIMVLRTKLRVKRQDVAFYGNYTNLLYRVETCFMSREGPIGLEACTLLKEKKIQCSVSFSMKNWDSIFSTEETISDVTHLVVMKGNEKFKNCLF